MPLALHSPSSLPLDLASAHQLIRELRAKAERLEALALLDPLTGIGNRRAFDDRLAAAFAHARRTHTPLAVAVIDLDNFKRRNDTFGHSAGDRCLQALASQLVHHSRGSDTVARIGGEEFAMILPNTSQVDAAELCRRIAGAVRMGCAAGGPLTFSAGVAQLESSMLHPSSIVLFADAAMYDAKQVGKDRVCVHQPKFNRAVAFFGRLGIR